MTTIDTLINTIASGIKTIEAYDEETNKQLTRRLIGEGDWEMKMNYTATGVVMSLKEKTSGVKQGLIITNGLGVSEMKEMVMKVAPALQLCIDNHIYLRTIGSEELADRFFTTYTQNAPSNNARRVWAMVGADYLLWSVVSQIYLKTMEAETNEGTMSLLAQKAKVAYAHSETALKFLRDITEFRSV